MMTARLFTPGTPTPTPNRPQAQKGKDGRSPRLARAHRLLRDGDRTHPLQRRGQVELRLFALPVRLQEGEVAREVALEHDVQVADLLFDVGLLLRQLDLQDQAQPAHLQVVGLDDGLEAVGADRCVDGHVRDAVDRGQQFAGPSCLLPAGGLQQHLGHRTASLAGGHLAAGRRLGLHGDGEQLLGFAHPPAGGDGLGAQLGHRAPAPGVLFGQALQVQLDAPTFHAHERQFPLLLLDAQLRAFLLGIDLHHVLGEALHLQPRIALRQVQAAAQRIDECLAVEGVDAAVEHLAGLLRAVREVGQRDDVATLDEVQAGHELGVDDRRHLQVGEIGLVLEFTPVQALLVPPDNVLERRLADGPALGVVGHDAGPHLRRGAVQRLDDEPVGHAGNQAQAQGAEHKPPTPVQDVEHTADRQDADGLRGLYQMRIQGQVGSPVSPAAA
jgi:hypothetical protein